jgi:hypothetical protein
MFLRTFSHSDSMHHKILQEIEDLDEFMMVLANKSPSSDQFYIACVVGNFTIAE